MELAEKRRRIEQEYKESVIRRTAEYAEWVREHPVKEKKE